LNWPFLIVVMEVEEEVKWQNVYRNVLFIIILLLPVNFLYFHLREKTRSMEFETLKRKRAEILLTEKTDPLPPGWEVAMDRNDQILYFNSKTEKFSRERPTVDHSLSSKIKTTSTTSTIKPAIPKRFSIMDDGEKEVPTFPWEEKLLKKALRKLKKERALREQLSVNTKYEGEKGDFQCQRGQGGGGQSIRVTPSTTHKQCQEDCLYHSGCKSYDLSQHRSDFEDSCRLYGSTTPRLGGTTDREFCAGKTS